MAKRQEKWGNARRRHNSSTRYRTSSWVSSTSRDEAREHIGAADKAVARYAVQRRMHWGESACGTLIITIRLMLLVDWFSKCNVITKYTLFNSNTWQSNFTRYWCLRRRVRIWTALAVSVDMPETIIRVIAYCIRIQYEAIGSGSRNLGYPFWNAFKFQTWSSGFSQGRDKHKALTSETVVKKAFGPLIVPVIGSMLLFSLPIQKCDLFCSCWYIQN
jgi:hypothetical protein